MDIIFEGNGTATSNSVNDTNSKSTGSDQAIRLVANTEFSELVFDKPHELVVMASVIGMTYETLSRNSRAPIDLVAVIDRSASMKDRINLMIKTLQFMIQQLKSQDNLGIVAYDSSVEVLLPLTRMDAGGKLHAQLAVEKLTARGQTNLSGGLLQALNMLRTQQGNEVCAVLLFTDGLANMGITKTEGVVKAVSGVLTQIDRVCSIFTFGYGTDPDPEFLKAISDQGNGMYYYISNPNAIPDAFADCLGGLLSVVAQNICLTIEATKHTTIKSVDTPYRVVTEDPGKLYRVYITDLYSEEQKDILCTIQIEALAHETNKEELVEFHCQWTNVILNRTEYQRATAFISRPAVLSVKPHQSFNRLINKQKNRLIAARALETAVSEGKQDRFIEAQKILQTAKEKILTSATANEPFCQLLVQQLEDSSQEVKSKDSFQKGGYAVLTEAMKSHYQQRATTNTMTVCYRTFNKTQLRDSYQIHSAPVKNIAYGPLIAPSSSSPENVNNHQTNSNNNNNNTTTSQDFII